MEVRCLLSNISFVSAFGNQILYTSPNQISLYIFLNILFFLFPKFPLFAIQRVLQIYFITCTSLLQLLIYLYIICSIQTNNISLQPANNPIKHMNQSSYLLQILKSCLNSNTVQQSQKQLVEYSHNSSFVSQLLQLLPDQEFNLTMMVMSTLKNFIQEKYNNPHDTMPQEQKQLLRNNLFNLYYVIANTPQAVNLYKQIVYMIVAVDYEKYTPLFYEHMKKDLDSGAISASVYFSRQVARFYEWLSVAQRKPLQQFINYLFPKLEELVEKILTDYNNLTRKLLQQLLQMFYSAFHIQVPEYLRNFDNLDRWLLYLRTTLKAPLDDFEQNHIQVSRIYVKLFSMYCRDGTDGKLYKGWGAQFRQKHGVDLYTQVVQILINPLPSQQVMANILTCITTVTNNPDLKPLFQQQHCQAIIYKHLLPFMQSTNEDYSYFKNDGLEYIRRIEDLTCHPYRRCSLDLIKSIMEKFNYGTKSQLIKFVQHSADVLGHSNYTDKQKQVIILVLIEIAPLVMKNNFLKENFETFIQQYFIPILKSQNSILISQTLSLLSKFLRLTNLSNQTVSELMSICYDKMCEQNIVVKYYAILAFTQLLDYKQALDTARPHFQNILQIYVKMLDVMDHEGLISSLKSIVQCFSGEIVGVAQNLANHLFSMFYELHNKESQQNGGGEEEQNESRQATAALSTIKSILQSPLSEQSYYQISEKVMILLQSLCSQYDDYFQQILNLLNTLVYKANQIVNFQFPYLLCRKLLEGDNSILVNCSNKQFQSIISEAEIADTQYSQSLISIIKNLIKKMPQQILHHYPYPTNPQLMLCMIQNKKLDQNNLTSLNTSQIDNQWSLILQSYTAIIYGFGEVCNTSDLKMLSGVSLYPWIQYKLDSEVIKKLLITLQDEQGEDDYYEENTVQMLQKYANQDEEQDAADYYISSGGNYSYMYDSPYDYEKDKYLLVNKMKKLSSTQFNFMLGQLSIQNRNRLESLFSQCQNLPTSQ